MLFVALTLFGGGKPLLPPNRQFWEKAETESKEKVIAPTNFKLSFFII